ncbi:hypothetical protein COLO4_03153 [Corchorus olitorius]|uniref:Uncharacterized protein n=1 Tax=Corchorus olitorius TaxID=93759 RepID=A0A1R3KZG4_9ROSI|nr:hypothetical protein COLO4_03153 [Corchorus olitorius]
MGSLSRELGKRHESGWNKGVYNLTPASLRGRDYHTRVTLNMNAPTPCLRLEKPRGINQETRSVDTPE